MLFFARSLARSLARSASPSARRARNASPSARREAAGFTVELVPSSLDQVGPFLRDGVADVDLESWSIFPGSMLYNQYVLTEGSVKVLGLVVPLRVIT